MKGLTIFVTYVLMRADREFHIPEANIDFRRQAPVILQSISTTVADFVANDSYVFAPERPGKTPFSHTVHFLRNPWVIACALEWLRRYPDAERDTRDGVIDVLQRALNTAATQDMPQLQSWQIAEYLLGFGLGSTPPARR
jgi:hypothetical protein